MIPNLAVIVATYAVARLLMLGLVPVMPKDWNARQVNAIISVTAIVVIVYLCVEIVDAANTLSPALGG